MYYIIKGTYLEFRAPSLLLSFSGGHVQFYLPFSPSTANLSADGDRPQYLVKIVSLLAARANTQQATPTCT